MAAAVTRLRPFSSQADAVRRVKGFGDSKARKLAGVGIVFPREKRQKQQLPQSAPATGGDTMTLTVELPHGAQLGTTLHVEHEGRRYRFTVPARVEPGGRLRVRVSRQQQKQMQTQQAQQKEDEGEGEQEEQEHQEQEQEQEQEQQQEQEQEQQQEQLGRERGRENASTTTARAWVSEPHLPLRTH